MLYASCLSMWLLLAAPHGQEILVDEVLAEVNRHVITRSELFQEALLVMVERQGAGGLGVETTPEFLQQILDMLINQRVLLDEARRLALPPVTEEESERLLDGFRRRFASDEAFGRFLRDNDLTPAAISETLVRHLSVERLRETKLRTLPEVSDQAVREYYEKNRRHLGGASLEMVAEAIRLKLLTEQREKFLAGWVWELRKRVDVKVLQDPARISGSEETDER